MLWANFLHFYQPPTQKKYWIDRITKESYRPIIEGLIKNPGYKVTLNINSILTELWDLHGHKDVIKGVRELLERGQIELTGSAKYHPLLPKLPRREVIRQIKLNNETHKKYFGGAYEPKGFFPPEMAYDRYIGEIINELGYGWVIVDEMGFGSKEGKVDYSYLYKESDLDLLVFFRERHISYKILAGYLGTRKLFEDEISERIEKQGEGTYLLTGMDGETFGHHRPGMDKTLFELYRSKGVESVLVSELTSKYKDKVREIDTVPSTWALMDHEVIRNIPFARWDDPQNEIHQLQWRLTNLAIKAVQASSGKTSEVSKDLTSEVEEPDARKLLDRALHSDQYWWASAKPWWSIEMIERGAKELVDAIDALPSGNNVSESAKLLYYEILEKCFEWQRIGKVEEISKAEDEIIRARTDEGFHQMDPEELNEMIKNISGEMKEVAANLEFERAAQLRDRIKELESYKKDQGAKGRV